MNNQFYVNVVNLKTGKIFSLPTLYADRNEACVRGQNYVRDCQTEDPCSELFFRVMITKDGQVAPDDYLWNNEDDEESEHGESVYRNTEESNYRKLMEGILEVCEEYGVDLVIPRT